jgi:hypothetical protein
MFKARTKPRRGRVRDEEYLDWLHTQPSIVPSHDAWCLGLRVWCVITVHHVRKYGSPKDDRRGVPIWKCRHQIGWGHETVEHGKTAFEKRFGIDLEQEIKRLNEKYEREA